MNLPKSHQSLNSMNDLNIELIKNLFYNLHFIKSIFDNFLKLKR